MKPWPGPNGRGSLAEETEVGTTSEKGRCNATRCHGDHVEPVDAPVRNIRVVACVFMFVAVNRRGIHLLVVRLAVTLLLPLSVALANGHHREVATKSPYSLTTLE